MDLINCQLNVSVPSVYTLFCFCKTYLGYCNMYKSPNSITDEVLNFISMLWIHLETPATNSHYSKSLQNKQLCFPNTLNWIWESGMALLQKNKKRLEHIYQFANRLKSVNSGTQAIRNVLLILHQCTPSCDVISFSTRFSLFAPLLLSPLH